MKLGPPVYADPKETLGEKDPGPVRTSEDGQETWSCHEAMPRYYGTQASLSCDYYVYNQSLVLPRRGHEWAGNHPASFLNDERHPGPIQQSIWGEMSTSTGGHSNFSEYSSSMMLLRAWPRRGSLLERAVIDIHIYIPWVRKDEFAPKL